MKLRPVFFVLLLLAGFYLLSSRLLPSAGTLATFLHQDTAAVDGARTRTEQVQGPVGHFDLQVTQAAPAFDSEEQQNIGVYKRALPSVVNITSTQVAYDFFYRAVPQQGQGSGFILDKQGHILTNNHVIEGAQIVEVTLADKHKFKAQVVTRDRGHDLALLQIQAAANLLPATLADSKDLQVGQKVYAIGNPFGFNGTMTRGIISAIRSIQMPSGNKIENAIQTDASVNPGNSGGPLLNSRGEVIGITTLIASNPNGGADQSAGIGFAIPISTAKAVLSDFAQYGRIRRPSLDIVSLQIGPGIAEQIGLPADYGILVQRVTPGGAAQRAGLHGGTEQAYMGNVPVVLGGDLIIGIDDQRVTTAQDLANALNEHRAGDTVTLTIFRGRRQLSVRVVLGEAREDVDGQTAGNRPAPGDRANSQAA